MGKSSSNPKLTDFKVRPLDRLTHFWCLTTCSPDSPCPLFLVGLLLISIALLHCDHGPWSWNRTRSLFSLNAGLKLTVCVSKGLRRRLVRNWFRWNEALTNISLKTYCKDNSLRIADRSSEWLGWSTDLWLCAILLVVETENINLHMWFAAENSYNTPQLAIQWFY